MGEDRIAVVDTSVLRDGAENRISDEVGAQVDSSITFCAADELHQSRTLTAPGNLLHAPSLSFKEVLNESSGGVVLLGRSFK